MHKQGRSMKLLNSLKRLMPKMGNPNNPNLWPTESYFRSLFQSYRNKTLANVTVTPENAFTLAAYWCAVRAISEDIAKLPVRMFTVDKEGKKKPIYNNALLNVLTKGFNDELDSMTGIQTLVQWLLTWQNAYVEIARNSAGQMQWYLIHPSRVQPHRDNETQRLYYDVESSTELDRSAKKTRVIRMEEDEIMHLKGAIGNGVVGYNLAEVAGQSLGISIAAQNFTSSFFGNNLSIGATLETPRALDADVKEAIRKEWTKKFSGSSKAGDVAILDRDFKFNRIQMASTDAELIKTREFQISEVARWFRIPPHKIMELKGAKFNNVEQQNIEYVTDCLGPWIKRLETQFKFKFHRSDNTIIDIDEKALLRGDQAARTQYYKEMYLMSAITPKQIAFQEGLPHEEASDKYYQQLNIQSVELADESQKLDNEAKTKALEDPEPEPIPEPQPGKEPEENNQPEPPQEEETEQQSNGLAPEACLAYYMPVMSKSIELLIQKESRAHESANKKQGYALTEHLNKFYSKFEQEMSDKLQVHIDYLCGIFGKQSLGNEQTLNMAKSICNMDKSGDWIEDRINQVCDLLVNECLQLSEAPQIGEVMKDDDGKFYMLTVNGYKECNVTI